jgi:hypothetical protein
MMKYSARFLSTMIIALIAPTAANADEWSPNELPFHMQVPDGYRESFNLTANGSQVFICKKKGRGEEASFRWVLAQTESALLDNAGTVIGEYHWPGAGWSLRDGSRAFGTKLSAATRAKDGALVSLTRVDCKEREGRFKDTNFAYVVGTNPSANGLPCEPMEEGNTAVKSHTAIHVFYAQPK